MAKTSAKRSSVGRNDPCPCGSGKKYKHCCGRPRGPARVLYVHPAKQGSGFHLTGVQMGRPYGLVPVGLVALVNLLRENGIPVKGINLPMEKRLSPAFDLLKWLGAHPGARVILIDMHWYEHVYGAIDVARACKQVLPEARTVIGGLSASAFASDILKCFPEVDYVIRGDAEKPLLRLVQQLLRAGPQARRLNLRSVPNLSWREGDVVVGNERTYCATTTDLDRLNFVDIDFLDHHDQYYLHEYIVADLQRAQSARDRDRFRGRWLCTARGCRYECSYCGGCRSAHEALAGRKGIVPRSPGSMVDDLRRLRENEVIQASLSYDIAEMGEPYWRAFLGELRKSGIRIGLYNEFFQLPKPAFVEAFAESVDLKESCVAVSPLSGSERVRRLNGKFYDNDQLLATLEQLKAHSLSLFCYFSLNLPGEDEQTIHETVNLAKRIYDLYPGHLLKILTSSHTIDPLCPMSVDPDRYGIEVDLSTFSDYYDYCRNTQLAADAARTEAYRGFRPRDPAVRDLSRMADIWDQARVGREESWWPVPPSW
ncbi:MAG: cobalamin-dependent protein [Anaerolineae bacterium]|nr:cobalamin-dependent protein [Anaerolineae bacterium]